jgi:hypothetical protein
MAAPATALSYPWKHLIAGHLGRLGTRDDVTVHQQYIADIEDGARTALGTVDPTPHFAEYGENLWAAVRGYLDAVADAAAAPVIEKYTGVLGAWMCSRSPPPFRSWSQSASTSAIAWTFTPEQDARVASFAWSRDVLEPRNTVNAWCRARACLTKRYRTRPGPIHRCVNTDLRYRPQENVA